MYSYTLHNVGNRYESLKKSNVIPFSRKLLDMSITLVHF